MSKKLVAYFSVTGTTRSVAKSLAKAADADLFEIKPEIPYTEEDIDWQDEKARSSIEMKDPSSRPGIEGDDANIAEYDVIFLGFPIWWYKAPAIINTFLENYDFAGKTIVLFATSGGSGLRKMADVLKESVDDTTVIIDGEMLNGDPDIYKLKQWVTTLGL